MSAAQLDVVGWVKRRAVVFAAAGLCVSMAAGCRREPPPAQGPTPNSNAEADTLADFSRRVAAYAEIHRKIEGELPKLPDRATPEQIDVNQRELGKRLAAARPDAKPGDLFTPTMQTLIHDHFGRIFKAKDGDALKASIMDENPVDVKVSVDGRYPDEVPLSTMPPEILQVLPKMPEELEYRFVGRHLVIMDPHAHIVADYVPNAIP